MSKRFRVLSLDGGGIKGTYTAAVLAELEAMTGKRIADHFDLVCGTSTGGIIAIALGLGIFSADILKFYVEQGPTLFPIPRWYTKAMDWALHWCRPKQSREVLRATLQSVIGDRKFGESTVRLVIPSLAAENGAIHLFKTAHTDAYKQDYLVPARDVALATAAAPTYYHAHQQPDGRYIDGGVWANNPAVVGLIEAMCVLKQSLDNVELLSIGTTSSAYHIKESERNGGKFAWRGAADMFLHVQCAAALGKAKMLTNNRMVRIDVESRHDRFALDDARGIADLEALGRKSARQFERTVSETFLYEKADPFIPCSSVAAAERPAFV